RVTPMKFQFDGEERHGLPGRTVKACKKPVKNVNAGVDELLCSPGFRLFADNIDEITHRDIDVHEVQTPIRLNLTRDAEICNDIVNARICGITVDRDLEVRRVVVRFALGRQQSWNAHPRRLDRTLGNDPGLRLRYTDNGATVTGQI